MMTDPLANMLTAIRNGQQVRLAQVSCPSSRLHKNVLNVLKDEGYIEDYTEIEERKGVKHLNVKLKYHQGQPVIRNIKRVSKPGRRVYTPIDGWPRVQNGLGISILSTSRGVMADHRARAANIGGEVLCNVF